jgi:hypothetical protein
MQRLALQSLPPEYRGMREVGSWLWMRTYTAFQQPRRCFSRELVYAKSSISRWIASRARKLSARWC